ncbi:MAG TPA: hypothetical protein VH951_01375 [Dehalococcoidia bacterium]|jgi:hypothetical protein
MSDESRSRVRELAERFALESIGAIDYGTNARALALRDSNVTQRIEALLDQGYRLKRAEPKAGTGASALSYAVSFQFERPNPGAAMDDQAAFTAMVELPTRSVKAVVEGDTGSDMAPDAPFALATRGGGVVDPSPIDDSGQNRRQREDDFLRDLLKRDIVTALRSRFPSMGVYNTYVDTMTTPSTKSDVDTTYGTVGGDTSTGPDYKEDDTDYDNKIDGSNESGTDLYISLR